MIRAVLPVVLFALAVSLTGCGSSTPTSAPKSDPAAPQLKPMTPAGGGGGQPKPKPE